MSQNPFIFIEDDVKINQHIYLRMLKEFVLPWLQRATANEGITFQQDGAISHTATLVQNWCKDNFKSFWHKKLLPPCSPDLDPMDFGIWSILEQKASSVTYMRVTALKEKPKKCGVEIESESVLATCDQVIPRLCRVIKEKEDKLNNSVNILSTKISSLFDV